jgi:hypothetical protein
MCSNGFLKLLRLFIVLAAACTSTTLLAQTYFRSDGGEQFLASFNVHGAVLQSARTTLYLGLSCDAWSPQYGGQNRGGVWREEGGFVVLLSGYTIRFSGQSLFNGVSCPAQ